MYGDFSLRIGGLARNVKWCSHYGKQNGGSSKKFKRELPYDPKVPLLGVYLKETKIIVLERYLYPMFIATLFAVAKIGKRRVFINR